MKKIGHIIRKEFLQLKRDPRLLPILFISPVMQLLLLGYAVTSTSRIFRPSSATSTGPRPAGTSSRSF
jgi:hypothetical protein